MKKVRNKNATLANRKILYFVGFAMNVKESKIKEIIVKLFSFNNKFLMGVARIELALAKL